MKRKIENITMVDSDTDYFQKLKKYLAMSGSSINLQRFSSLKEVEGKHDKFPIWDADAVIVSSNALVPGSHTRTKENLQEIFGEVPVLIIIDREDETTADQLPANRPDFDWIEKNEGFSSLARKLGSFSNLPMTHL